MRLVFAIFSVSAGLAAQTVDQVGLGGLTQELRTAIQNDSFVSAADLAAKLDDAVQAQHRAWLVRDSGERVEEVLSWLPADIDSFWVNQSPFPIGGDPSARLQDTAQLYSLDRLMAQNQGALYHALANRTVRLVVAAARGIALPRMTSVPGPMTARDVAYFYFFTDHLELPPPDESIQGKPAWQGTAHIVGDYTPVPRTQPPRREDRNWIALARPDLLVLSNQKDFLVDLLDHISHSSARRALPAELPEWGQVDRSAALWGLRHHAAESRPNLGERGCESVQLPYFDCTAAGVTVRFDAATQRLEARYLSESGPLRSGPTGDNLQREFQIDQPEPGVWRMVSDLAQRGAFPLHFAMLMLGFGMYQ